MGKNKTETAAREEAQFILDDSAQKLLSSGRVNHTRQLEGRLKICCVLRCSPCTTQDLLQI